MREINAEQIVLELLDAWFTKSYGDARVMSDSRDSSRLKYLDERAACHDRRSRFNKEGE